MIKSNFIWSYAGRPNLDLTFAITKIYLFFRDNTVWNLTKMALRTSNLYESNHSLSSNINAGNVGVKVLQVVIEFKRIGEIGNN